jgi:hypothetical protein
MVLTNKYPRLGSNEGGFQFPPPMELGKITLGVVE